MAIVGLMLLAAGNASAQSADGTRYVQGYGGLGFSSGETGAVLGGEFGMALNERLSVYGTVGQFFAIGSDELDDLCGSDCDTDMKALFVIGGVKYAFPTSGTIRPYAAGGLGFARTSFNLEVNGREFDESATNGVLELGGGIDVPVGQQTKIDPGYRLMKIFEDGAGVAHRVYVGFGVSF